MLSILIVDDEFVERDGVKFLIEKYGLELEVAECIDGEIALEYLKHHSVDILFTDVKMPFLDGLQLSKYAKVLYPDLKIIIFSGYGEFEYARTAISLGVSDYILKPMNPETFCKTMKKVIKEVEETKETSHKRYIEEKEHILTLLLSGKSPENVLENLLYQEKLEFLKEYCQMVLIEFDEEFFNVHVDFQEKVLKLSELNADYFNLNSQQSVLMLKRVIKNKEIYGIFEQLQKQIQQRYQINCYFGISMPIQSKEAIFECFSKLEQLMENRFFIIGHYCFLEEEGNIPLDKTDEAFDQEILKNIENDVKRKDFYGLRKHISYLGEKYSRKSQYSHIYVKFIFSGIYKEICKAVQNVNEEEIGQKIYQLYVCRSIYEIIDLLNGLVDEIENKVSAKAVGRRHETEMVLDYIYQNYGDDFSLNTLAEHVYMTPSYLSSMFKKEMNIGINSFVKKYRMEKAKDMLENTNIKVKDIGIKVGYSNTSYFCKSYRDYFGITPEQFRKKEFENE